MTNKYDIYFNSGGASTVHYFPGDNISFIEITNSDDSYYQNGVVQLYKVSAQNVGDTCMIFIDGSLQFNGYVSRRQQTVEKGTKFDTYQLVGKTYDLWRYVTDENALYSGTTTNIVASLVNDYCDGISSDYIDTSKGISLTSEINLTNIQVGDAISRLSDIDGFSFYVDNEDNLRYYYHSGTYKFSITEDDIINMEPIEEADEDLINDCLVIGGTDYSAKTIVSPNHPQSKPFPNGVLVAQRFDGEDPRLSAIKLYLDRSTDPDAPGTLEFEIWENTELKLFEDDFNNLDLFSYSSNICVRNSDLNLATSDDSNYYYVAEHTPYNAEVQTHNEYFAQTFIPSNNGFFSLLGFGLWDHMWCWEYLLELRKGALEDENILWSTTIPSQDGLVLVDVSDSYIRMISGETYAFLIKGNDGPYGAEEARVYLKTTYTQDIIPGKLYHGKGSSWGSGFHFSYHGWEYNIDGHLYYSWSNYETIGYISSISYPNDCRYMKLDLTGVVSSNHIFISGTNDGGSSRLTLKDGEWVDFGSESSDGCIVYYKLSSNGHFTPRIGSASLMISDDSGGFEDEIFDDNFNDNSFLSSQATGAKIYNGAIYISTSRHEYYSGTKNPIGCEYTIYDGYKHWNGDPGSIEGALIDGSLLTYAQDYGGGNNRTITDIYEFDAPMLCDGIYAKANAQSHSDVEMRDIYISTTWSDWIHVFDGAIDLETEPDEWAEILFDDDWIYSGIRKIKVQMRQFSGYEGANLWSYGILARVIGSGSHYSGLRKCFKTNNYTVANNMDMSFLEVKPTNVTYNQYISYSGSLNSGSSWTHMSANSVTDVDDGKNAVLMYCFQTSGVCNKVKWAPYPITNSPSIGRTQLYAQKVIGGGVPKSGTRVEWSDDISWSPGDVPYPPSYSSWKTYSEPKLAPDELENNTWWMIFTSPEYDSGFSYEYGPTTDKDDWEQAGTVTTYTAYGGSPKPISIWPNSHIWKNIDLDSVNVSYVEFEVCGTDGDVTGNPITCKIRKTSSSSWVELATANPSAPEQQFSYKIPSSYYTSDFWLRFEPTDYEDEQVFIRKIGVYTTDDYWAYHYDVSSPYNGKIAYSWDNGINWSTNATNPDTIPDGNMSFQLGWRQGEISYRASNQTSINKYGKHFKKISDSSYTTFEQAQARAELEVSGMETIPKKGSVTIEGITDIDTYYRFSSNLTNFGINEIWDVVSYTQRIDQNGFTTTINYGKQPYDIARKVAELEHKQEIG